MIESKRGDRRVKTPSLAIISGFHFLLLGVVAQIFIQLVMSVSSEARALGLEPEALVQAVALITLVLLGVVLALRWTQPFGNEEPVIILMLWIVISTVPAVCVCCHHHDSHSHSLALVAPTESAGSLALAPGEVVIHMERTQAPTRDDDEDDNVFEEFWASATHGCRQENFDLLFTLLALGLVVAAYCTELANYYATLFFRLVTVTLLFLLVVLLVLAPSTCARFSLHDLLLQLTRATLYHALWWLTQYKRLAERALATDYSESLVTMAPLLRARETHAHLRKLLVRDAGDTPAVLFDGVARLGEYLGQQPLSPAGAHSSSPVTRREARPVALDEEAQRALQARSEAAADDAAMQRATTKLVDISEGADAVLSWRNRDYSKHQLRLIDLARTVWVLLVCPAFLWFSLLEFGLLFYCIHRARCELGATHRQAKLLSVYAAQRDGVTHISLMLT